MNKVNKLYFMFHPVCWAMGTRGSDLPPLPQGIDPGDYRACLTWEKSVNQRQKEFISRMKPDEALILFPISRSEPMLELERHAEQTLGSRCIIVRRDAVNPPASWAELPNPIERFLDDHDLTGKAEFLKQMQVPPDIQAELEAEIREACRARGYNWSIAALKVIYFSRLCAMDLNQEFRERGLVYDPATVESEAFGEGFEQCAMTWKAMLVPYLGLAKPADNVFDLSVSAARFLVNAHFKERVRLKDGICLYLWQGADGRPIALFARSWCRLKDPQFYVSVPLQGLSLEVWTEAQYGTRVFPDADANSTLKVANGHLRVPVFNAIRRDATDGAYYLIARHTSFDAFRQRLVRSGISQ